MIYEVTNEEKEVIAEFNSKELAEAYCEWRAKETKVMYEVRLKNGE